jgi:hypothetical protein
MPTEKAKEVLREHFASIGSSAHVLDDSTTIGQDAAAAERPTADAVSPGLDTLKNRIRRLIRSSATQERTAADAGSQDDSEIVPFSLNVADVGAPSKGAAVVNTKIKKVTGMTG